MATQSLDEHFETSQENMGNIQWERVVKSNADTVNTHANAIHLNKVINSSPVAVSRIVLPLRNGYLGQYSCRCDHGLAYRNVEFTRCAEN